MFKVSNLYGWRRLELGLNSVNFKITFTHDIGPIYQDNNKLVIDKIGWKGSYIFPIKDKINFMKIAELYHIRSDNDNKTVQYITIQHNPNNTPMLCYNTALSWGIECESKPTTEEEINDILAKKLI